MYKFDSLYYLFPLKITFPTIYTEGHDRKLWCTSETLLTYKFVFFCKENLRVSCYQITQNQRQKGLHSNHNSLFEKDTVSRKFSILFQCIVVKVMLTSICIFAK